MKKVRFYNAEKVHNFPADRWELQARGDYAEQITNLINKTEEKKLAKLQAGLVTHCIDFVRKGETWRDEEQYYFWKKLREGNEKIKLRGTVNEFSIEKTAQWFDKQVSPSQSMLYFGLGRKTYLDYMESLAIKNANRLNEYQLATIRYLQKNKDTVKDLLNLKNEETL